MALCILINSYGNAMCFVKISIPYAVLCHIQQHFLTFFLLSQRKSLIGGDNIDRVAPRLLTEFSDAQNIRLRAKRRSSEGANEEAKSKERSSRGESEESSEEEEKEARGSSKENQRRKVMKKGKKRIKVTFG